MTEAGNSTAVVDDNRRFGKASENDLADLLNGIESKKTKAATRWALKQLTEYCVEQKRETVINTYGKTQLAALLRFNTALMHNSVELLNCSNSPPYTRNSMLMHGKKTVIYTHVVH